jgi:hypothetical protein
LLTGVQFGELIIFPEERMLIGKFVVAAALLVAFAYLIYVLLYPEKF